MKPPRVISLFSGAGGLDIGFHDAGFKILKAVELEKCYSDIMKLNTGKDSYFGEDVEVLNMDVDDFSTENLDDIDWIIGGPPCQTFSAAGRRANGVKGLHDPRGILFERYVEIVKELKPRGFLYENVYGLVGAEGGEPWRLIRKGFEEVGYKLYHRILDAADYGAPQHRERVIIVGVRDGEFKFPRPTHGPDSVGKKPYFSAEMALRGLPNQDWDGSEFGGKWGHLLPDIPGGLNYSFYTAKLGHPNPVFAWRSKFSDFLYKADPKRPVRTIKAQGGKYTGPLHWANRHFHHEELKLLQSFPKSFKLGESDTTNRAVVGNSVPPALARALAEAVITQVFGFENKSGQNWLEESDELTFRTEKRKRTKYYQEKAKNAHINGNFVHNFIPDMKSSVSMDLENGVNGKFHADGVWCGELNIIRNTLYIHLFNKEDVSSEVTIPNIDEASAFYIRRQAHVVISPRDNWDIPADKVEVIVYKNIQNYRNTANSDLSLTAGYNVIREVIKRRYGIDDLIQLNGYYQQGEGRIQIENYSLQPQDNSIWKYASILSQSNLVGVITGLSSWCNLFNVNEDEAFHLFQKLKSYGFDIRDNSTNQNISPGDVLVTYRFPTLTTSKVQWQKKLGGMIVDAIVEEIQITV